MIHRSQIDLADLAKLKRMLQERMGELRPVSSPERASMPMEVIVEDVPKPLPTIAPPRPVKGLSVFDTIAEAVPTRAGLDFDNPVSLLCTLMPEITPYRWQYEELMRSAGYIDPAQPGVKFIIDDDQPYKLVLSAANGSGKDMIVIAAFAVWFMLKGVKNRVIITSSSFDQTKNQTEPSIRNLCNLINLMFPTASGKKLIEYTQFHYVCPELGSEIKLYATDEAAKAEGYHPWHGGQMALIINEAKSVSKEIFDAVSRCTGYSYWLEVSSPGPKRGHMYNSASRAVHYPAPVELGRFYFRRVTAFECPHIKQIHIREMIYERGEHDPWVRSSIYAEFSDYDEPLIITDYIYDECLKANVGFIDGSIGIGVDFGAGVDETSIWVRRGNKVIFNYHFVQKDTMAAALIIDTQLSGWKSSEYSFNADNGGVGQALIDNLVTLGWNVKRRNNQSPARRKAQFLNLGAEMWFHLKRLLERKQIIIPHYVSKLREQLTGRFYKGAESTQGKLQLESKAEARAAGHKSPDRADGLVLCYFDYRPSLEDIGTQATIQLGPNGHIILPGTIDEFQRRLENGYIKRPAPRQIQGRFSNIGASI